MASGRKTRKLTIREFAKLAETSTATVSRAFSNKAGVSEKERKRILQLAQRMGYSPNRIAQNLALQKSHVVGLVAGDLENPAYVRFFRAVQQTLEPRGYQILIADSERSAEKERHSITVMQQHQAEGILIFPVHDWDSRTSLEHLIDLRKTNFPFVVVGKIEGYGFDCVTAEEMDTAATMTRHLLDLGHRRIGFVGAEPYNRCIVERLEGVKRTLAAEKIKLNPRNVIELRDGWIDDTVAMLQRKDRPTALVFINEILANMAFWPMVETGLNIPKDLSICAFGDSVWARHNRPAITTTQEDLEQVARQALDLLMQRIANPGSPSVQSYVAQKLTIRNSTAPAPPEE